MSKAGKRRTRRIRRQLKAVMRHGPSAKPTHKGLSGRTGSMHHKMLRSATRGKGKAVNAKIIDIVMDETVTM